MKELLALENLIELYDNIAGFANHHANQGGQEAHRIIKNKLIDDVKSLPRDGSKDMDKYYEGYDKALKEALSILRERFFL